MELFKDIFNIIIVTIITGCGVTVVGKLMVALNSKIDELQASTKLAKYEQLNKYIDSAQSAIYTAVITVTQTFADNIKGTDKWNDETKNEAKQKAIDIAKELISEDAKIAINEVFGDFQTYLVTTIEQTVKNTK